MRSLPSWPGQGAESAIFGDYVTSPAVAPMVGWAGGCIYIYICMYRNHEMMVRSC